MQKIVLYIDSMQRGGAQRVMSVLCDYLSTHDWSVILVNDIVPVPGREEYGIGKTIKRVYLDNHKTAQSRILRSFHRVIRLRQILISESPDVVLSFIGPPNIRMLIASIGLNCRKIVSVRNDPYREYGNGIKKLICRSLFCLSDGCVFQTKEASDYFTESLRERSTIILNPVDDSFYKVERKPDNKTIIMVGRLEEQKNYPMAIGAFSRIADKFPMINLNIYGTGRLKNNIQAIINDYGLNNRITLEGQTNDVESKLSKAILFLLTSDFEGMPNALMEAMAVGLPVISTDCPCGGPKVLINSGENGSLIQCRNVDALAEEIERVLSSEELMEKYSRKAKMTAYIFKEDQIMQKWEDYLNNPSCK